MEPLTGRIPRDQNRVPVMGAVSSSDGVTVQPAEINPSTGRLLVDATVSSESDTSANLYTGQKTVGTSAVQVSAASHTLSNGVILKAPSTNGANIYVGLTGVTTTTGDILEPGESRGYPVNNTNLLYIVSAASTTDVVSFEGN